VIRGGQIVEEELKIGQVDLQRTSSGTVATDSSSSAQSMSIAT
jgi:hypothetical protein